MPVAQLGLSVSNQIHHHKKKYIISVAQLGLSIQEQMIHFQIMALLIIPPTDRIDHIDDLESSFIQD